MLQARAATLLRLALVAHTRAPAALEHGDDRPEHDAWQRQLVEDLGTDEVADAVNILLIVHHVVSRAEDDASDQIGQRVRVHGIARQHIADRENADDQGTVKATHGRHEEDRTVDRVHLGILERFDMSGARPAYLLQQPAQQGRWCVG